LNVIGAIIGHSAPDAIVFGGAILIISPFFKDSYASLPASGSTPWT